MYDWVICVHSPHMHSINYILLQFFAAAWGKDFGMQELGQLAAQFDDAHMQCCICICARMEDDKCLVGKIDHTFKTNIYMATL